SRAAGAARRAPAARIPAARRERARRYGPARPRRALPATRRRRARPSWRNDAAHGRDGDPTTGRRKAGRRWNGSSTLPRVRAARAAAGWRLGARRAWTFPSRAGRPSGDGATLIGSYLIWNVDHEESLFIYSIFQRRAGHR